MKRDRNLSLEIKELIGSFFGLVIMLIGIYTPNYAYYFSGAFLMIAQVLHVAHPEIIKKAKAFYSKVRKSNIIDTFVTNIFWIVIHFFFSVLILLPVIYREITRISFLICWILLVMFSIFIGIRITDSWNDCNFEFSDKFKKNIVLIGAVTTIIFAVPSFKDVIDLLNSQTDITLLSKIYNFTIAYASPSLMIISLNFSKLFDHDKK